MTNTQNQIEEALQSMLRRFLEPSVTLTAQTDFSSDLALESIQIMEFMVDIEDHFDIAVDMDSLSRVTTIRELAQVVHKLVTP